MKVYELLEINNDKELLFHVYTILLLSVSVRSDLSGCGGMKTRDQPQVGFAVYVCVTWLEIHNRKQELDQSKSATYYQNNLANYLLLNR